MIKCVSVCSDTVHACDQENSDCVVEAKAPWMTYSVGIERCILNEIETLWSMGIRTTCSCCGHGIPENAYVAVEHEYAGTMEEMGYEPHSLSHDCCLYDNPKAFHIIRKEQ